MAEDALNIDLAAHTGLPAILIARDQLGTLSALFSALMVIKARQLSLAAIVLNQTAAPEPNAPDNLAAIEHWLPKLWPQPAPPVIRIPWQSAHIGAILSAALASAGALGIAPP